MQLHHVNGWGKDNRLENILSVELSRADRDLGRPRAPAEARRQVRLVAHQRWASLNDGNECALPAAEDWRMPVRRP